MAKKYSTYKKGYLPVSDGYKLYYELFGNPKGIPVLFVHGGPGAGFTDRNKRFFDPKIFNVIFFDQRGSGRSKPFASLKNNTTPKLVQDIRKLLKFLKIKKVFLFGGSWGSTLSLVYAIKYPKTVLGMLLYGIYFASKESIKHYVGGGVRNIAPDKWKRFISHVPKKYRKKPVHYYLKQMKSKNPKIREKYAFEYSYYEVSISQLKISHNEIVDSLKEWSYKSLAPLEAHYFTNNSFIPDNYILKNAHKLSKIPVVLVHGRYDLISPALHAYKLHKKIKNSKLYFTCAGHVSSEKENNRKLISEMKKFGKLLSKKRY